jgi:hypothetical protein
MTELARRASEAVASAAGDGVAPHVTQLAALTAVATGHPELAWVAGAAGALVGAVTTEVGSAIAGIALRDRADRYRRFLRTASEATGVSEEDLLQSAKAGGQRLRDVLTKTAATAAESTSAWKVDAMAKIFARALRGQSDPAMVDEMLLIHKLLEPLDVAHARLLAVMIVARKQLHRLQQKEDPSMGTIPVEDLGLAPPYHKEYKLVERGAVPSGTMLKEIDRGLVGRVTPILAGLSRNQLAYDDDSERLKPLGWWLAERLEDLGAKVTHEQL